MAVRPLIVAMVALFCGAVAARAADRSQEPGAAEAHATTRAAVMPKTWSHPAVEVRGVWVARNDMERASEEELAGKMEAVKRGGFNTVIVDTWFQGYVPYAGSKLVPQYPKFKGFDPVAVIVKEAHARGMAVELWPSYGFYAYFTPDAKKDQSMGALLDAHPELVAVDDQGRKSLHRSFGDFYSLCPSNPESQELLAQLYVEQVTRYAADGLSFDRIRYPEDNFCFCDCCKEHFRRDTGLELKAYPAGSAEAKKLLAWRREQTAKAVARFREAVLKARPGLTLTAYVVGPFEMDSKAQAWDLWMKRGLLDAVAVSMYGADIGPAARRAIELLDGRTDKLICAINAEQAAPVYLTNIEAARGFKTMGQFTWYLGPVLKDVEGLAGGPYAEPARSPLEKNKPVEAPNVVPVR